MMEQPQEDIKMESQLPVVLKRPRKYNVDQSDSSDSSDEYQERPAKRARPQKEQVPNNQTPMNMVLAANLWQKDITIFAAPNNSVYKLISTCMFTVP